MESPSPTADRERIMALAPDLAVKTIRNDNGQFNDVLIVNEAWVFRFAKSDIGIAALPGEVAFLSAIAGRLPLSTPVVQYLNLAPPHVGMGYPMLSGVALTQEWLAAASEAAVQRVGAQLGSFLRALHTLPLDMFSGVAIQDGVAEWAGLYANIRAHLFPHMRSDAQADVSTRFEAFLATGQEWTPVPRHGDFGTGNVLLDEASGALTAVIDFGSAALGDPAVDIAALSTMGETILQAALAAYPEAADYQERAAFYRSTFALQQAWYGIQDGSQDDFEHGIARYR